jgi:hypothetical protein
MLGIKYTKVLRYYMKLKEKKKCLEVVSDIWI